MTAIISLLAALCFPVVKSFIDRANGAKCAGNLRQLGAASALYVLDHSGFLPVTFSKNLATEDMSYTAGGAWYWLIAPYVDVPRWETIKSYLGPQGSRGITAPNIFCCPSHDKHEVKPLVFPSYDPISYAPSTQIATPMMVKSPMETTPTLQTWGLRFQDIKEPGRKIWLSDSVFPNINNVSASRWSDPSNNGWARIAFSRHDGAGNVLFYDGHVERFPPSLILNGDISQNILNFFDPTREIK